MFGPEATRNLYCNFATLRTPLQVVACKGKQYGTMHSQTAENIVQKFRKQGLNESKQRQRSNLNRR